MSTANGTMRSEWQCINDIARVKIADAECHGGAGVCCEMESCPQLTVPCGLNGSV